MDPNWEEALDHFKRVIDHGTEAMRLKTVIKLAKLSNQAPENILGHTIPILACFVGDHSSNCSSPSLQGVVVHCLNCISRQGDGRLATKIGQSGTLLSILRLLPESDGSFQRLSVQCLWCLANLGTDDNRVIVANNGGLEIIVNLLNSSLGSVRRYLLKILSALSMLKEVRRGLAGLGGFQFLADVASYGNMLSRERACQAIGLLAITRQARCSLVELGVIPVLVQLLRVRDSDTKLVADNTLGVISTQIDYLGHVAQAGAIPLLAELLQGPDPLGWDVAENALCLLALNEENEISIADRLVTILKEGNNEANAEVSGSLQITSIQYLLLETQVQFPSWLSFCSLRTVT
ncbi:hypothetical protein QQP08_022114 [Theobroma cacao]|nr:hypothetical protein QQP08_022114 [Theobroma cacao]